MKIALGSDHGGFELKEHLKKMLAGEHELIDLGTNGPESVDYPDYAVRVARLVAEGGAERGILICSTGIGMSVTANKVPGVRAALAFDLFAAQQSRRHVDANILVLGDQITGKGLAAEIARVWLETPFEGGRHQRRIDKIKRLENDLNECP